VSLSPGTRLGVYEIVAALGAGGMGEVYTARDTRLDRTVAIKVVTTARAGDAESRLRFEQEARTIAALNHPHICTIHDVGRQVPGPATSAGPGPSPGEAVDYLVMEYLEGETLADRIRRGGPSGPILPIPDALAIAIQIGDALTAAHRVGIVHRDLKPGNVMLVRRGGPSGTADVKLLDFGLAAQLPPAGRGSPLQSSLLATTAPSMMATRPPSATTPTGFSGTVQYMAPEQMDGAAADQRADIFAFGCVLYEMLAGRKAFGGATAVTVIAAIMSTEPRPVEALQGATPVLDHLLRRCLEKDPARRWQDMGDVTGELRWIASQPLTAPVAVETAPGRLTAKQRVGIAVAAALLLFVVIPIVLVGGMRALDTDSGADEAGARPALQFEVATPPTDLPHMALSPDGTMLVFVANEDRRPALWLRMLDRVETRKLPGTEGAQGPFWSPDGRSIGFFTASKLKRLDVRSGASLELADIQNGRGADWGPDGTILFSPGVDSPIMRVSSGGGEATAVTTPEGRTGHRSPQFLEDGTRFIFYVSLGTADVNGTYIGSLDGAPPVRVLGTPGIARFAQPPGHLLAVQQGSLVAYQFGSSSGTVTGEPVVIARGLGEDATGDGAFTVSNTGVLAYRFGGRQRRQLQWVDRRGTLLTSIGEAGTDSIGSPELSPDERTIALFLAGRGGNDIGVIDLARNLPRFITNTPPADAHPLWDPDGRHVVYVSARLGGNGPVRQAVDGTGQPAPLFPNDTAGAALSWTRDRRFVLLRQGGQRPDLVAVSVDGSRTIPIAQSPADETEGQFSPDGRWVAFVSHESGRAEVYLQAFPQSAGRTQVSTAGGTQVRWSADGREIFFIAPDGRMMAVSFSPGPAEPTVSMPVALFQTWLATGGNVIGNKPQYAVTRDGRFLLNSAIETPASPIVVTVNWPGALAR
jgi:serine/threonine protein kinase/Tol biopolymer transport system component